MSASSNTEMDHGCGTNRRYCERTAHQFIHALRGDLYLQNLLNPTRRPTESELNRHIDFVVETFLAGARKSASIG